VGASIETLRMFVQSYQKVHELPRAGRTNSPAEQSPSCCTVFSSVYTNMHFSVYWQGERSDRENFNVGADPKR